MCMRLSIFVNLVGRCDGLLAIFTLVCSSHLHGWSARGALLLLIHVARGFYIAITYPPRCRWGLLAIVYRLLAIVYHLLAIVYRLLAFVYRLLATVYRSPLTPCCYYPLPACLLLALTRLLAIVYRLPALLAGAALVIAHTCVADRIA